MSTTMPTPAAPARRTRGSEPAVAHAETTPLTRLTGGAFIAAPLALIASSVAWAAGSEPTQSVLGFYACAVFALVIVTLTASFAHALPRAAAVLTLLGLVGAAAGVGFNVDNLHGALLDDAFLVDDGGATGALVAQVPGLMFPAAWVGIGIALLRTGVVPRSTAVMLIAAGALFPASRIGEIEPLAIADDLLFCIALIPLGWAILQGRDALRHDG